MKALKKQQKASVVTSEFLAETVYDPNTKETRFAVCASGEMGFTESIFLKGKTIYPLDGGDDLIQKSVILLPSLPIEYGDEAKLLEEIRAFIHKYVDITPMYEQIASYYVLFSWVFDKFHEVPYLRAIGDFGSGKSRFIRTIGSICYRPIFTGGATTTAPIFRILDDIGGTLVLDEADLRASDMTNDMVKILNTGYEKGVPVLRTHGKDFSEIKAFNVFSPKIIATREKFDDKALESRFLVEEMGQGSLRKDIPRNLRDGFSLEALDLRNKLLMWRFRNFSKPICQDEKPIEGIHPRLHQIIVPLLSIIESEEMRVSLKEFVMKYNNDLVADRGLTRESDIIFAILKLEHELGNKEVTVGEIAKSLNADLEVDDFDGKITASKAGWYLRAKLQLKSEKTRKGYILNLEKNRAKLNFWKERFGITDADIRGEDVNLVNDVNVTQQSLLNAENVGF